MRVYLFDQIDGRLEIQAEVHEFPIDVLSTIFFLFENEHGVIEQLLQFLVRVIDTHLFEGVQSEDFEAGNVQNANKRRALSFASIERLVDPSDNPFEHAFVNSLGYRFDSVINLNERRR
jgi:hypothetical protein